MVLRNAEIAQQKQSLVSLTIIIGLVILMSVLLVWNVLKQRQTNKILKLQTAELISKNEEIYAQRDTLEHNVEQIKLQHHQISASIRYAKDIQDTILPSDERVAEEFEDFFILYKPKDLVSGDFYWLRKRKDRVFWALADCTGHGVLGALLSKLT